MWPVDRMFNNVSLELWCHAVVHFGVEMCRFSACFQDDGPEHSGQLSRTFRTIASVARRRLQ